MVKKKGAKSGSIVEKPRIGVKRDRSAHIGRDKSQNQQKDRWGQGIQDRLNMGRGDIPATTRRGTLTSQGEGGRKGIRHT